MENRKILDFSDKCLLIGTSKKQVYNFNTMLYFLLEEEQIANKNGKLSLELMVMSCA